MYKRKRKRRMMDIVFVVTSKEVNDICFKMYKQTLDPMYVRLVEKILEEQKEITLKTIIENVIENYYKGEKKWHKIK